MIKKINNTQAIKDQLKKNDKISFLDEPHHIEAINSMNEQLANVKREYEMKERNSQIAAANGWIGSISPLKL